MPKSAIALVSVAFAVGILAVEYAPFAMCVAVASVAILLALALARDIARGTMLILAASFVLGAARCTLVGEVPADDVSQLGYVTAIRGTVASDPEGGPDRTRFVFRIDRAKAGGKWRAASGRAMVSVYSDPDKPCAQLDYGDRAVLVGGVYRPFGQTNPGRFSWRDYLARQGIHVCASIRGASHVKLLRQRSGNPLVAAALAARHHVAASISKLHRPQEASVIIGMVLGTYAYLPNETFRNFSRTGTLHLLAASGYNCYVLLFLTGPLLKLMRVFPKWRHAAAIAAILAYLLMAGAKPSLVRAAIMASLLLAGRLLKRVPDTGSLFFTAGLVILAIDPGDLYDVGFQLSFLAVWGLIWVSPVIGAESVLKWAGMVAGTGRAKRSLANRMLRKTVGGLGATAIATVAVTLVTTPVVAYYFNYISLVSLPANMIVELGVPVVFAVGFLSVVGSWFGWLGALVGWVGTWVTRGMLAVVNDLGSLRYSSVSVAAPGPLAILGYYLILFALLSHWRSRRAEG